ncbi:MAG: hypothetical protein QXL44_07875 [Candidatus Nitrosocaldus sp.]
MAPHIYGMRIEVQRSVFYSSALRAYVYLHMSVCTKSPDYLTNSSLGRWVFATSH